MKIEAFVLCVAFYRVNVAYRTIKLSNKFLLQVVGDSNFLDNLNDSVERYLQELKQNSENSDSCFEEFQVNWDEAVCVYKQGESSCNSKRLETIAKADEEANTNKLQLDSEWESIGGDLTICHESATFEGITCYEEHGTISGRRSSDMGRDAKHFLLTYYHDVETARVDYVGCEKVYGDALLETQYQLGKELEYCVLGITTTTVPSTPGVEEPVPELEDSSELLNF